MFRKIFVNIIFSAVLLAATYNIFALQSNGVKINYRNGAAKIKSYVPNGPMKGKSIKHTFTKHGSHNTKQLKLQAKNSKMPQGQWINDVKAEKFIADNLGKLNNGAVTIKLPKGLGRVISPDGIFIEATHVRLVPSGTGVKTAYPIILK